MGYTPYRSSGDGFAGIMASVIVLFFVIGAIFAPILAVDRSTAIRAAEAAGYMQPRVVEEHYFFVGWQGCSSGDAAAFLVSAKNAQEKPVSILVCSGWPFKGSTVRIP
jgi:hypothetical protein